MIGSVILGVVAAKASAQDAERLSEKTLSEIRALEATRASRTPEQKKISSHLLDALAQGQKKSTEPGSTAELETKSLAVTAKGALVDIKTEVTPSLLSALRRNGALVVDYHERDQVVRARLPLEKLESVATRPEVKSIVPAAKPATNAGPPAGADAIDKEGRIAHDADKARAAFQTYGAGVTVGIISDGIDDGHGTLQRAYARKIVTPAILRILKEGDPGNSGEGLAMAEIIHAIAPKAALVFATGTGNPSAMGDNIRALAKAGCRIIVDDITYDYESPFQEGPIGRAIEDVTAAGVLYFSSAGNSGNKKYATSGTWEGDFRDSEVATDESFSVHAFAPGISTNAVVNAGQSKAQLFWAEPLGAASAGYGLYVIRPDGSVAAQGTTEHDGDKDPYQWATVIDGESIVITKSKDSPSLFLHLEVPHGVLATQTGGAIRGHNASGAANAVSVAAAGAPLSQQTFTAKATIRLQSADGPRRMFFKSDGMAWTPGNFSSTGGIVFNKPDIAAADGVTTSFQPPSKLNPFSGTSAAAAHAAAIAALVMSYDKTLAADDIRHALEQTALAISDDASTGGVGIVMPFQSLQAACLAKKKQCPAVEVVAGR